jgi:hypothetical protein
VTLPDATCPQCGIIGDLEGHRCTPTPEPAVDVAAVRAALDKEADEQRAHEHDASTSAAREENGGSDTIGAMYRAIASAHARKAEIREQASAALDQQEREIARLKAERDAYRAEIEFCSINTPTDSRTQESIIREFRHDWRHLIEAEGRFEAAQAQAERAAFIINEQDRKRAWMAGYDLGWFDQDQHTKGALINVEQRYAAWLATQQKEPTP